MGLFGQSRKKSIWDIIGKPGAPIDPGMTSDNSYDPSGPMATPETESPTDPASRPKKGFNWGRAAIGFLGGPEAVTALRQRDLVELQRQKEADAQAQAQHIYAAAKQVIKDPTEWAAFQTDPAAWAKARLGNQYDFHDLAQGHTGVWGNPASGGNAYTAPETFNNGPDRVQYDGSTGQSNVVYHGKDDWSRYADSLGLQPGTPQYNRAQQDFALRAQGPGAFQNQQALQAQRIAGQEEVRGMPTYGQTHPTAASGGKAARPTATRVVGGKAYYKVHGQWYDNPEGN